MIKDLVTPADIRVIQKKLDKGGSITPIEATLKLEASMSESQIQIACHNLIKVMFPNKAVFLQIDNGGKMGIGQRIRKKAEGTHEGFPDVEIKLWKDQSNPNKPSRVYIEKHNIYIEFKKIKDFCKSSIKPEQQYWHDFLKDKGESVHFCNNTVYFEQKIMKEIEEFIKSSS